LGADGTDLPAPRGRSPRWRPSSGRLLVALGWVLFLPGVLCLYVAWGMLQNLPQSKPPQESWIVFALKLAAVAAVGGLAWWSGTSCVAAGRRMRSPPAAVAMGRDPRPPILYLRSSRQGLAAPPRSPWKMGSTYEEHLAWALGDLGPFVALDGPGEGPPEADASPLDVEGDRRRRECKDLMARSRAVVLAAGGARPLRWALQAAVGTVGPERLVIFLPFSPEPDESGCTRLDRYESFRLWAHPCLPKGLPERDEGAYFLYFDADWTPRALVPPRTPFLLGLRRLRVDATNEAILPILDRLCQDRLFQRPMAAGPIVLMLLLVLAIVVGLLSLLNRT
jgi:hypothetical protein